MTTTKFDVVEWFAEKAGKTYYRDEIAALRVMIKNLPDVIRNDDLRERMKVTFEKEIETITREAQDRYDDWASDPDY